jgi:signal peptidase
MKKLKVITNVIYWIIISILIFVAASTAFSVFSIPKLGYQLFVVRSGSMEPAVPTGSVVVVSPRDEYLLEDIITYKNNPNADIKDSNSTTTHRIIEIHDDEGRPTYTTKGDANNTADTENIPMSWVLGKMIFPIPLLGYVVAFAKTQAGLIVLIIIPATMIVSSEISKIKNQITELINKTDDKKQNKKNEN